MAMQSDLPMTETDFTHMLRDRLAPHLRAARLGSAALADRFGLTTDQGRRLRET